MLTPKLLSEAEVRKLVRRDTRELAPKFRRAVDTAIAQCRAFRSDAWPNGLDAMVYEAVRTDVVQQAYYALGRTVIPPVSRVTNAKSAMWSWHFFGLAVDVISESRGWKFGDSDHTDGDELEWIREVARIFKANGCDWGGDWPQRDYPHFQWGRLRASPSDRARELYSSGATHELGLITVWREVGAIDSVTIRTR